MLRIFCQTLPKGWCPCKIHLPKSNTWQKLTPEKPNAWAYTIVPTVIRELPPTSLGSLTLYYGMLEISDDNDGDYDGDNDDDDNAQSWNKKKIRNLPNRVESICLFSFPWRGNVIYPFDTYDQISFQGVSH